MSGELAHAKQMVRLQELQNKVKVQGHSAPQPQGAAVVEWYRFSRKEFGEEETLHHMLLHDSRINAGCLTLARCSCVRGGSPCGAVR